MKLCPFCNNRNEDDAEVCQNCGVVFSSWEETQEEAVQAQTGGASPRTQASSEERPEGYENGGLVAWSVVTMLLFLITGITDLIEWNIVALAACLVPGILGLLFAVNINCSVTKEKQEHRANVALGWCITGTILWITVMVIWSMY